MGRRIKYEIKDLPSYSELADDLKSILERLEGSKNDDEGERALNDLLRVLGDLNDVYWEKKTKLVKKKLRRAGK